jgi:hypothetical protein
MQVLVFCTGQAARRPLFFSFLMELFRRGFLSIAGTRQDEEEKHEKSGLKSRFLF